MNLVVGLVGIPNVTVTLRLDPVLDADKIASFSDKRRGQSRALAYARKKLQTNVFPIAV